MYLCQIVKYINVVIFNRYSIENCCTQNLEASDKPPIFSVLLVFVQNLWSLWFHRCAKHDCLLKKTIASPKGSDKTSRNFYRPSITAAWKHLKLFQVINKGWVLEGLKAESFWHKTCHQAYQVTKLSWKTCTTLYSSWCISKSTKTIPFLKRRKLANLRFSRLLSAKFSVDNFIVIVWTDV